MRKKTHNNTNLVPNPCETPNPYLAPRLTWGFTWSFTCTFTWGFLLCPVRTPDKFAPNHFSLIPTADENILAHVRFDIRKDKEGDS